MTRRGNSGNRCGRCAMHLSLCICDEIPRLETRTTLHLVIHHREARRTTNTGGLAARCLRTSEVLVHGRRDESPAPAPPTSGPALLLFPSDSAHPLTSEHGAGPHAVTLYVPDGSWRQARRMIKKLPWLDQMQHVCLPPGGAPSTYRLRAPRDADDLATAEAIARAMGILEGDEVREAIERVFRMMVERTLFSRGVLPAESVFGGIPPGVMSHDPLPPGELAANRSLWPHKPR